MNAKSLRYRDYLEHMLDAIRLGSGTLSTRMSRQASIRRLVSVSSMGLLVRGKQIGAMTDQPLPGVNH